MMRALKKSLALILSVLLILSMAAPMTALGEGDSEGALPAAETAEAPAPEPTAEPTQEPTPELTQEPTPEPTQEPTPEPTQEPTPEPTQEPTPEPTQEPTPEPTEQTAPTVEAATAAPSGEESPAPAPTVSARSVTLDVQAISLFVGETQILRAQVVPSEASFLFDWTSSDEEVVAVSSEGVVRALSPGAAVVTYAARDESGVSASCAVAVPRPITSLEVTGQARIQVGKSCPLAAMDGDFPVPGDALVWTSSDDAIARVDGAGVVTALAVGCARITAAARDGSGLTYDFPLEVLRATVVIHTGSNKEYARAVSGSNEEAEDAAPSLSRMARGGNPAFQLMRLLVKTNGADPMVDAFNPDVIIANRDNRYHIQFTSAEETEAAYEALSRADYVKYVEPDSITSVSAVYSYNSWGAAAMNADLANEHVAAAGGSLKVAVIDSGVSSHSFLGAKLIKGYDYVDNDADPTDLNGHGTHVAGTIVDLTRALNVSVVAYRAFDAQGNGSTSNITNAIIVAADEGCKVINLSARGAYSAKNHSSYLEAVSYAISKGAVFCCAAGNDAAQTSSYVPASFTTPGCIVVASVNQNLAHSDFSNIGASVDVAAPGESILSCNFRGGYAYMSGTSMATPHVSAACAIIKLANPGYGPAQIESALKEMCVDLGSRGFDNLYGHGIPDLISMLSPAPTGVSIAAPGYSLAPGGGMQLSAAVSPASASQTVVWSASDPFVAGVSAEGYVTGIAPGAVRITAKTVNGLSAHVDLVVELPAPTGVSVTAPQASLSAGSGVQLSAAVIPAEADQTIVWDASDPSVATVDAEGYVTARAAGTVRITARTINNLTDFVELTIESVAPTGVEITALQAELGIGALVALSANVLPAGADQRVTWESSDAEILSVSPDGATTAIAPGTARITATTINGLSAFVDLTVVRDAPASIAISAPKTSLKIGEGMQLSAAVLPDTAQQEVTWSSLNKNVLSVSPSGYITAAAPGKARIQARAANQATGEIELTVLYDEATGVAINSPGTNPRLRSGMQLSAAVYPATADQRVVWSSQNPYVATITADGYLTPHNLGYAEITVRTENGLTHSIILWVDPPLPTSISIQPGPTTITLGNYAEFYASISPWDADQSLTWTSSNNNVLTPVWGGTVYAKGVGTARLTARAPSGLSAYVDVTVAYAPVESLSIYADSQVIDIGALSQLAAFISPSNADPSLTWSSSNTRVLTVSQGGLVKGVASGTARVTARAKNNLAASIDITVGARISEASASIGKKQTRQLRVTGGAGAVSWSSANPAIAKVSATGLVTGVAYGRTEISASVDGLTLKCSVQVLKPTLSSTSLTLSALKTAKLSVQYSAKSVRWSSSRSSVASVNSSGKITARKAGKATITATVDGHKLKCTVTVKENGRSFSVDMNPRNYDYGATLAIKKVYYKGSSVYVDVYLVNNFSKNTIKSINNLKMSVYDEGSGTLIATKKFSRVSANLKPGKMKKITLKFTSSATKHKSYELRLRSQAFGVSGSLVIK